MRAAALAFAFATANLCVVSARADTSDNDAEVEVLVQSVFESEYPKKHYVEALEQLQLASTVCQEGSCSPKIRAKVLVGVATVLAGGLQQKDDAVEVFKLALKEDPKVKLIAGFDKGAIAKAWAAARGKAEPKSDTPEPSADSDRKKYPGGGAAPRGWRSAEAHFYFKEAQAAESDRAYTLCVGYADDSISVEDRIGTRALRAGCLDRLGRWVRAAADYAVVESEGPKLGLRDAAKSAKERRAALVAAMPKVILRPPPKADDLRVRIDDEDIPAERLGAEEWIDPGQHRITASGTIGGQALSFERDISIDEGKTLPIDIKLVPQSARVTDNRILKCLEKSKSRDELATCIGEGTGAATNLRVATELSGYTDSDNTSAVSPAVVVSVTSPTGGWSVGGSFMVDVVTSASTDIVATASPRYQEMRYVPGLNGSFKVDEYKIGLGGGASIEPDYRSIAGGVNVSTDLLDKRLTPTVAYGFGHDTQGRSGTPYDVFSTTILQHSLDVGVSIVADKATVVSTGVTLILQDGDTSKPYRYVPLFSPEVASRVPPGLQRADVDAVRNPERAIEQLPTSRQRLALYGKVAHRFDNSTLRIDERLYTDSWGLLASTTDGQFFFDVSPRVRVWPHARLHAQTGANFWQIAYESEQTAQGLRMRGLRTGDRELGPLFAFSLGGGGRIALGEDKNWGLTLSGDVIYNRYLNHLYILERLGVFGALGAEVDIE